MASGNEIVKEVVETCEHAPDMERVTAVYASFATTRRISAEKAKELGEQAFRSLDAKSIPVAAKP